MDISKLEALAKQKEEELEKQNFDRYRSVFDIAIRYFRKQPVLMYGGLAIHELMPKSLKIYSAYTLPDIDVFTYKPKEIITGLLRAYKKSSEYDLIYSTEALHENTYKIYVHGIQIADITAISKKAFDRLSKQKIRGPDTGIAIADPQFLRMTLHQLLAQSNDAHRWPKVFERLQNFYKAFPPKQCNLSSNEQTESIELDEKIYRTISPWLQSHPYVLLGHRELEKILRHSVHNREIPSIQLLVDEGMALKVATDLREQLQKQGILLHESKVYDEDEFVGNHMFLMYKKERCIGIYEAKACTSYVSYEGFRVATIHTMIYYYMAMLMSSYDHFESMADSIECLVNQLAIVQKKSTRSRRRILQQFVLDCYGVNHGLITLRRERLMRLRK